MDGARYLFVDTHVSHPAKGDGTVVANESAAHVLLLLLFSCDDHPVLS